MHDSVAPSFVSSARPLLFKLLIVSVCASPLCYADTMYTDLNKLFKSSRQVTTLGPSLFGDKVSLYTGALEFVQTDVSLPGNSRLPVSVGRRLIAGQDSKNGLFGAWDLEIPHLHGVYSKFRGWVPSSRDVNERCSNFSEPAYESGSYGSLSGWNGTEFWQGSFLYVPGIGDQELLRRSPTNTIAPLGNSYPIVTRNNWQIRCLASMDPRNGETGQAFVALSPDGTEYQFDWMVSRDLPNLTKASAAPELSLRESTSSSLSVSSIGGDDMTPMAIGGNALARKEVWILPTKITDRFGNSVTYTYDTVNKWQLQRIVSNDESGMPRQITFSYLTPGSTASRLVSSISDGTRTWSYRYGGSDGRGPLTSVTMPDNSTWQLAELEKLATGIDYLGDGNCEEPGMVNRFTLTGTATHPSGARGEFVLNPVRHARVGVPRDCREYLDPYAAVPYQPNQFDTFALTKKTITGPGLPAMEWVTTYPAPAPGWAPWNGQNGSKQVEVRGPDGHVTRHVFGTVFMQNEAQVQAVEYVDATQGLLRRTSTQYTQPISPRGTSDQKRGDGEMAARVYEVNRREIVQQSTTFLWQATAFDAYAQPTTVVKSSSQGASRTEVTTYDNNLSKWVLGQVATVTETSTTPGTEIVRNGYNSATANLESVSRFTLPEKTFTYHADGNVAGEKDGRGYQTTYTNYRRGIPQNVSFADGKTTSASINNLGGIDWVVDPTGARTDFGYDAMGRFASIAYPGGDPVTWRPTTLVFEQVWTPEFDLPAGHWRQTITTGAGIEANYFDAFWRPVYSVRRDNDNQAATERLVMHQYDADGRNTFDSYPVRSYGATLQGVRRGYDALGRLAFTETDSELGLLRSTVSYDPAVFRKTQTDALNHSTIYEFQVFDQPSEDAITKITASEGVVVTIVRVLFDKPLSITRGGGGKSLARSYQYDRYQRLTKTTEPETGATLQGYDAASNVVCRASGMSLAAATACNATAVPLAKRTTFSYDERNRLKSTTYGDGSPAITRTYTADGLPETISSGGAVWTYAYNKRRLNTSETLAYGGKPYRIGRSYDANGSLTQLDYAFNLTLDYKPNALGEAGRIGGYATDIQYHPNGAVAGFVYANGIRRELHQHPRGLPKQAIDSGVLNEVYVYDANGNVTQIEDRQQQLASRTMTYDDLDRVRTVSAPGLWGIASYNYDAIDNLISTSIGAGANARTLTHAFNSTTNRLASTSGGPAKFNFTYAYDDQGNVTQRGAQTYRFDQGNRLTAADGRASYAYDGLGHRVSTVGTDQVNTLQIYTQAGKLLYSGPSDGSGTKYIYLNNHVIAEVK